MSEMEALYLRLEEQQRLMSNVIMFAAYGVADDRERLQFLREWHGGLSDDLEAKFSAFQVDEIALTNGAS